MSNFITTEQARIAILRGTTPPAPCHFCDRQTARVLMYHIKGSEPAPGKLSTIQTMQICNPCWRLMMAAGAGRLDEPEDL